MTQRERQILRWIEEDPMITQQELAERAGITRSSAAVHVSNLMKKGHIAGRGYILRTAPYAVVVGGANMDIGGRSMGPLVPRDSNPGQVRMSLGGVGRNIAHNLALLGVEVRLLTAFGDDVSAQKLAASCGELGIDISQALQVPNGATSTYLYLAGPDGDMELAVSDMEIYDHLTPAFLQSRSALLSNAQLVVTDTNIPEASLQWLAENCRVPLFADPVSTAKAEKLRPILGKLHTLKPNRLEAELLSGVAITDISSARRAAQALLDTGLRRVFLSLGAGGVLAADHNSALHLPCPPAEMVNTTGCGDAFMAAIAWAYLEGTDLEATARLGLAASAIAMGSAETINPAMSAAAVRSFLSSLCTKKKGSERRKTFCRETSFRFCERRLSCTSGLPLRRRCLPSGARIRTTRLPPPGSTVRTLKAAAPPSSSGTGTGCWWGSSTSSAPCLTRTSPTGKSGPTSAPSASGRTSGGRASERPSWSTSSPRPPGRASPNSPSAWSTPRRPTSASTAAWALRSR